MKCSFFYLIFTLAGLSLAAQPFPVDTLQYTGPDDNRIVLVFVGDGYRISDMEGFRLDVRRVMDALFDTSPFREYRSFFNVYALETPSQETGADHPGTATDVSEPASPVRQVQTIFESTYDYFNIHRLLVPTNRLRLGQVLFSQFPQHDQALVIVNSEEYGGSGGTYATTSANIQAAEIAIHELGHSFAFLADEYYAGDVYSGERANMTAETSRANVRWKNWLDEEGIGIYQHCCGGQSANWYRPHEDCKMRYLGRPFCAVCTEALIDRIYGLVSPIDRFFPAEPRQEFSGDSLLFSVSLQEPSPSALQSEWLLNGRPLGGSDSLKRVLIAEQLGRGDNLLVFQVRDETPLSRTTQFPSGYLFQVSWTIRADGTVSTPPVSSRLSYRLFPNPSSDWLYLELESKEAVSNIRLSLYDAQGRLSGRRPIRLDDGVRGLFSVDLRRIPAGWYTAVLEWPGFQKSFSLLKQ